jgi:hypothetical protein
MKAFLAILTIIVLLAEASSSRAAVVKPNGKYAVTVVESCEAKFAFSTAPYLSNAQLNTSFDPPTLDTASNNAVKQIMSVGAGHIGSGVGYLTLNSALHTFVLTLTNIGGGALRVSGPGITGSTNVGKQTVTVDGTFTYTASSVTLTVKPSNVVLLFTMATGELDATGRPSSLHLVRKFASAETVNCVQALTATR